MKRMRVVAISACLCLVAGVVSAVQVPPPKTPLAVTLTPWYPCPISLDQSMGLKALITGGYPRAELERLHVVTSYSFSAQLGQNNIVIKTDTSDPTVWWVPKWPGDYQFNVVVKQTLGATLVSQATAELSPAFICQVKKVAYGVTLNVSPPSGQAIAPPQTAANALTLNASISNPFGNPSVEFHFVVQKMNGPVVELTTVPAIGTFGDHATWTPVNPTLFVEPGLYRIAVGVVALQPSPQGNVVVADGAKEINYYEVKAAKAFGNVVTHAGDQTVSKKPLSDVSLTVTPSSPTPSTVFTMIATVSVAGNPSGVTNKFIFSYAPSAVQPTPLDSSTDHTSGTTMGIQVKRPPGTYNLGASVETRRTSDNTLVAQGSAQILNYVIAGPTYPYGWLFPVTTQNTTLAVGTKYGSAANTIAENCIGAIANNPNVKVRADNSACASCHGGSWSLSDLCSKAPNYLTLGPHASSGQPADQTLSNLLANWKGRNCPN